MNKVLITVTGIETGDTYLAKSYPDSDYDNNGSKELYSTSVYKVTIESDANKTKKKEWKALRFMPYWNDPTNPSPKYKTKGWVNSGLTSIDKKKVTLYDKNYKVHNSYSPFGGAIQIQGNFLIHAGPSNIYESGWGAAGCVEIIGSFDDFKKDIADLAGINSKNLHEAMLSLVKSGNLFVEVQYALRPDLKNNFYSEY
jgi:hypothetical protein